MTVAPPRPLAALLRDAGGAAGRVRAAVERLAEVAGGLDDDEAVRSLGEAAGRLAEDTYALMALGRFNAGKSTLINALLAAPGWPAGGLVPVGDEATTPTLIRLEYAERPYVRIRRDDGGYREVTFEQFRAGYVLDSREDRNVERFGDVVVCDLGVPAELLRRHLTLYDTPGTAETQDRDDITRAALLRCDAAVAVYRMGEYGFREVGAEEAAREEQVQIFTVLNTFGADVTEARRESAWNKLVLPRTGEEYAGQSLAGQHIHFVDARAALRARSAGTSTWGTGLDELEDDLAGFLLTERQEQHVSRYLRLAGRQRDRLTAACRARAVERWTAADRVEQRRQVLDEERARARTRADAGLESLLDAERESGEEIRRDFAREVEVIGLELRHLLRNAGLPSWKTGGLFPARANAINRAQLGRELAAVAQRHAVDRLEDWSAEVAREIGFRAAQAADELAVLGIGVATGDGDPGRRIPRPREPVDSWRALGIVARAAAVAHPVGYSVAFLATLEVTVTMESLTTDFLGEPWGQLRSHLAEYERQLLRYAEVTFEPHTAAAREHAARALSGTEAGIDDEIRDLDAQLEADRTELDRLNGLAADLDDVGATLAAPGAAPSAPGEA